MKVSHVWLRLYSPWNSPGQNTEKGSLSLLQGIFPTQGSNPGLLHCRWILYQLSHKGSPKIAKVIPKKRNRAGGITLPDFRQCYSNQNSVLLVQKQTYGPVEQDREPRSKLTHLRSINLQQRRQDCKMGGERQSFQQVVLGKLDSCI